MTRKFTYAQSSNQNTDITLLHGDCLESLKNTEDASIQLIMSSPPYNIGKIYEQKQDMETYLSWQEEILRECVRVLKPNGSLVWQVGNHIQKGEVFPLDMFFYHMIKKLELQLRNRIIWHFDHGLHAKNRLSGRYETVLWFTKTNDYLFNLDAIRVPSKYPEKRHYKGPKKGQISGNPLGKNPSDYWKIISDEWDSGVMSIPNVKSNHVEKTSHPCQFPVELVERFVLALSNEGDMVLDPFAGVGSSAIAALKHGRLATLMEQNQEYLDIAKNRIGLLEEGLLKLRPLGKPIHKPVAKKTGANDSELLE